MTNRRILKSIVTASVVAGALSLPGVAGAAIIRVNSLDGGSVAGACSITDAVAAANGDVAVNGCSAGEDSDVIIFDVSGTVPLTATLFVSSNITIDARSQGITVSGAGMVPVFGVGSSSTLELWQVTVASGAGFEAGGLENFGTAIIRWSTFAFNSGLFNGAINNEGTLLVIESTLYGNTASLFPYAGAIRNAGTAQIVNSTISGNITFGGTGGAQIGGVGNTATGNLTIINSTFSGNGGQGGALGNAGTLVMANTLLANDGGVECSNTGSITAAGVNFVADGSCALPGALSGDAQLAPLADNGAGAITHALLFGSPAIDAADNDICAGMLVNNRDQRGLPRPMDGNGDGHEVCDIGSFEREPPIPFSGFLAPVDSLPVVNAVKAGRAVPVKFSLDGDRGLNIFASGSPASQQVTCDAQSPVSDVEQTMTAGGSSLSYDAASDTYTYVWKTSAAWAGTCRQLVVRLIDGSSHIASFKFR